MDKTKLMPRSRLWPWVLGLSVLTALFLIVTLSPAHAEGETLRVTNVNCQGVTVTGDNYTPGQALTLVAKAPQGEGALTEVVEVHADDAGKVPVTTLTFGGQIPDGTYVVVLSTPGGGQRETVEAEFNTRGCMVTADPGTPDEEGGIHGELPFTGMKVATRVLVGVAVFFFALGAVLLVIFRKPRQV